MGIGTMLAGKCKPFVDYDVQFDENGLPLIKDCLKYSFMDLYTAPEVASSFQALYQNENGLLDKMFEFWKVVATRFKNNQNVIGYDILNEPWGINYHENTQLLFPQQFSRFILYPIAVRADSVIRAIDD